MRDFYMEKEVILDNGKIRMLYYDEYKIIHFKKGSISLKYLSELYSELLS